MDLLRRIRWTNVARAAAVAGVLALIAAWPQLRADPPSLPPEPAVADAPPAPREQGPEFGVEPPSAPEPRGEPQPRAGGATPKRSRRKARPRRPKRPRTATPRRTTATPPAPSAQLPAPAPARQAPPPPAPAGNEFGFE